MIIGDAISGDAIIGDAISGGVISGGATASSVIWLLLIRNDAILSEVYIVFAEMEADSCLLRSCSRSHTQFSSGEFDNPKIKEFLAKFNTTFKIKHRCG